MVYFVSFGVSAMSHQDSKSHADKSYITTHTLRPPPRAFLFSVFFFLVLRTAPFYSPCFGGGGGGGGGDLPRGPGELMNSFFTLLPSS
jgi:hypothetical protein